MDTSRRIAVLFGAGASRDAGLPLTSELAESALRQLAFKVDPSSRRPSWLTALNFTYGAMISYRTRDGSNPLDAVNIETLISALRLLRRRDEHEVAPFVMNWREPVLPTGYARADDHTSRQLVDSISQALGLDGGTSRRSHQAAINVGYHVAEIAEFARNPTRAHAFEEADDHVIKELGKLLSPTKPVGYLHPLADLALRQVGGLDVITLNYDLTVELAMSERSLDTDRGVHNWPSERVSYDPKSPLRLHKVHGSLDWSLEGGQRSVARLRNLSGQIAERPWVVVGDREKLATHGPTLELMQGAADALERAQHVVIVGYGFADDHINEMIRNWLERDDARTIGLVEPNWAYPDNRTFRGALSATYGERWSTGQTERLPSRIQGFEGTTATELPRALQQPRVTPESEPSLQVGEATHVDFIFEVPVELTGSPLKKVHFSTSIGRAEVQFDIEPSRVTIGPGQINYLEKWLPGEELLLRIKTSSTSDLEVMVETRGFSLASEVIKTFSISGQSVLSPRLAPPKERGSGPNLSGHEG